MDWITLLQQTAFLLLGGISALVGFGVITLVIWSGVVEMSLFRGDERNPYRRYCKKCGQQQDAHGRSYNKSNWWEDMGKVFDEDCPCHDHSTYHAL